MRVPTGVFVFFISAGVCVSRGRGTIKTDEYGNERKRTEKWVCRRIPRGFACRCGGWLRAKSCRWGNYCSSAPQIKTQYSQYSQYSQSAPPAEYSKTLRLCRILAQNYRRVVQSSLIAAGVCVLRGRGTIETDGYGNERKRTEKWCATGYSVGLRCRCLVWLGRKCAAG